VQILQTHAPDRSSLAAINQFLRSVVFAIEISDQQGLARDLKATFIAMSKQLQRMQLL
jgi:hypothetical protein